MDLLNLEVAQEYMGALLRGLSITVGLTLIVMLLSLILAVPVALFRISSRRSLSALASFYIEIMRTTPLILQLIYIFYVLPAFGIRLNVFTAAVVGLTLHYTALLSEVYRAGIQAIDNSQWDAAAALGLSHMLAFRLIVFPQAIRIVVPPLGNYFITLFKDTALTSVLTLRELMFTGEIIAARNYQYFTIYTLVGILYFTVGYIASVGVRRVERHMALSQGQVIGSRLVPSIAEGKS